MNNLKIFIGLIIIIHITFNNEYKDKKCKYFI